MELTGVIADELAREALGIIGGSDDNSLINDMAEAMGASSATLQEAFLTAVRIRRAEARAKEVIQKHNNGKASPAGQI